MIEKVSNKEEIFILSDLLFLKYSLIMGWLKNEKFREKKNVEIVFKKCRIYNSLMMKVGLHELWSEYWLLV